MAAGAGFQGKSRAETEAWILSVLEADPLPVEDLLAALRHFGASGLDRRVESWAELLQEALIEKGDGRALLRVLALRCSWHADRAEFMPVCAAAAEKALTSRLGKVLVKHCGFDSALPPSEAVRRLSILASLEKGVLCFDKTWGFGTVKRMDDFYARVTIDFENKRGHEMAFAYAAEVLTLLPPTHLRARLHREGDSFRQLALEHPGSMVRIALESYGPLNADALKEQLVGTVIEERVWKPFWTAARKALKADPLVHLPAKRTEPLQRLESAESHVEDEFDTLVALRVPEEILRKVDALEAAGLLDALTPARQSLLADRLGFAVWGSEDGMPVLAARLLLTAERLGVVGADGLLGERAIDVQAAYGRLLKGDVLPAVLIGLPARMTIQMLDRLLAGFRDRTVALLLDLLPTLPPAVILEAAARLDRAGAQNLLSQRLQALLGVRKAGPSLLVWILRDPPDAAIGEDGVDVSELLWQGLEALERPASGEMLKAQHQLRRLYEDGAWLTERLKALSPEQRDVFMQKLQDSRGWDETGRRSVIAGIIKAYPELQASVNRGTPDVNVKARMTSWRSYRERQQHFKKLVEQEIPENAREIAVARSYGDLRENSEYKYAKEQQRFLYRRRDEMEKDLDCVKGTDFAGFETRVAGMGTTVRIRRPDGSEAQYAILGEWDRDEALGIISSLSRLAQCLEGHKAGDIVELPEVSGGMERCEVLAVEPPDEAVQAWLKAEAHDTSPR